MGFLDSLKKGSFSAVFKTVKELFPLFVDEYLTLKAKLEIYKQKGFDTKVIEAELKTMDRVLDEVEDWCEKTIKVIKKLRRDKGRNRKR